MVLLNQYTGRDIILYASNWTQPVPDQPGLLSIDDSDLQGLMETVHGLTSDKLDLILHSPGGSAEAAESLVDYLRSKFDNIRVIVPHAAMSAATMMACAADSIMMGKHSSLGPIDPQIMMDTQTGFRSVPAQAIIEQFDVAQNQVREEPDSLASWLPLLSQYNPGLLVQCMNAKELAQDLVSQWLGTYMFDKVKDRKSLSSTIARHLSEHENFKSHARHINREKAKDLGLVIDNLEDDQKLQDLVLSVFHATTLTFSGTGALKIIENHMGRAYIQMGHGTNPPPPPFRLPR